MRKSDKIYKQMREFRRLAQEEIVDLIKSTGNSILRLDSEISIPFFNGWGDGWQNKYVSTIEIGDKSIKAMYTYNDTPLPIEDIHMGEWWYILESVEMQILDADC